MVERVEHFGRATLYLGDCRAIIPRLRGVDAVVTDPPYGIGYKSPKGVGGSAPRRNPAAKAAPALQRRAYPKMFGDDEPFDPAHLLGFPKAILWGANHYAAALPSSPAWLVWDKRDGMTPNRNSDCELAWMNFGGSVRQFKYLWNGMCQAGEKGRRVHPTQKPIALMHWCLDFVPDATSVMDPYMGSGTTGIAAIECGKTFIGIEKSPEYFGIACRRIEAAIRQGILFGDAA